ncbi:hypothetical protein D1N71_16890, partial [Clostridioides difficile]
IIWVSTNFGYNEFFNLKLCNNECKEYLMKSFCWLCLAEYNNLLDKDFIFEDRCEKIKKILTSAV